MTTPIIAKKLILGFDAEGQPTFEGVDGAAFGAWEIWALTEFLRSIGDDLHYVDRLNAIQRSAAPNAAQPGVVDLSSLRKPPR